MVAGAAGARRCPGSGRLTGPPAARTPPPTPPRPASPTRPGVRPPTSRSPSSTCSATKTSPTPCASARPDLPRCWDAGVLVGSAGLRPARAARWRGNVARKRGGETWRGKQGSARPRRTAGGHGASRSRAHVPLSRFRAVAAETGGASGQSGRRTPTAPAACLSRAPGNPGLMRQPSTVALSAQAPGMPARAQGAGRGPRAAEATALAAEHVRDADGDDPARDGPDQVGPP